MIIGDTLGLVELRPDELARITGGTGTLEVGVKAAPPLGTLDLTYKGDRGFVSGKLSVAGKDWMGGIAGGVKLGKATLEGSFTAGPKAWEVQATLRIPLGRG